MGGFGQPGVLLGAFTDDQPADAGYMVTIDWGDNTGTDYYSGQVQPDFNNPGTLDVFGNHSYITDGSYTVDVTVTNNNDQTDTASWSDTANIADEVFNPCNTGGFFNGCGQLNLTEGSPFSGTVVAFADSNPNASVADFSAQINWGDNTPWSTGTVVKDTFDSNPSTSYFYVQGTHTYAESAPFNQLPDCNQNFSCSSSYGINVTVTNAADESEQFNQLGTGANVQEAGLEWANVYPVTAKARAAFAQTLATFADGNPTARASNYTAQIDWGDGATKKNPGGTDITNAAVTGPSSGVFAVTGGHKYAHSGSYRITITLWETDNKTGSYSQLGTFTSTLDFASVK